LLDLYVPFGIQKEIQIIINTHQYPYFMKQLFILILVFAVLLNASAQNDTINKSSDKLISNTQYFGLGLGLTSGFGFSYIYWPKSYGIQVTAIPAYSNGDFLYSAGLTFLKELATTKRTCIYLYLGNQVTNIIGFNNRLFYNIGIGPGIEQGNGFFKFHLRIGYGLYFYDHADVYDNSILKEISFLPTVEIGWFYNFGKER
jgi:hypothetical protein